MGSAALAGHVRPVAQREAGAVLDWPATLRARQGQPLAGEHLRWRRGLGEAQALHVFALDCSASMVESGAFAKAKGLLLQWLRWAYLQRVPVALLCFGAGQLQWTLLPRRAPQWNGELIEPLLGGGGTPLASAFHAAWKLLAKRPEACPHLWVLSDFRSADVLSLVQGRAPAPLHILVDCEPAARTGQRCFGGAERLAKAWPGAVRLQPF